MGEPARSYSWAPFHEGNTAALKSGAHSSRMIQPIADRAAAELLEVAPWCARPAFAALVQRWAWAEARCILLRHYLDEEGLLDEDGEPRPAVNELHRAEATAHKAAEKLALSPMDFMRLMNGMAAAKGADVDGVEALMREGRGIVETWESEHVEDQHQDDGQGSVG